MTDEGRVQGMTDEGRVHVVLAKGLFDAIASGDPDSIRVVCAEDAVLLLNGDPGTPMSRDDIARRVTVIADAVPDFHYDDIRCEPTPSGFVREHVMKGTSPQGATFAAPACCVGQVVAGRIVRIDEYADPARLKDIGLPAD